MLAYEAFIRRASAVGLPFMLKGSYVTRQYFPDPAMRLPNDLDWIYLNVLENEEDSRAKLDEWTTRVTELTVEDGVRFRSFQENAFWRRIDYAMHDDFPTVNTDLMCWVDGEKLDWLGLDISFNLDVEPPPVPLLYTPLRGEPFTIPYSTPIALQVAWKLHQTLVRPRFKDMFDLIYLLKHPLFDEKALGQTWQALVNECAVDSIDISRLKYIITGELDHFYNQTTIVDAWNFWRHEIPLRNNNYYHDITYEHASRITDVKNIPDKLKDFKEQVRYAMNHAGFDTDMLSTLPSATRTKRKSYEKQKVDVKGTVRPAAISRPESNVGNAPISSPGNPATFQRVEDMPEYKQLYKEARSKFFRTVLWFVLLVLMFVLVIVLLTT